MPLLKDETLIDDPWVSVDADGDIPAGRPAIVGLDHWRARRDELAGRNAPIGIRLRSDQSPAAIADDLQRFSLVALEFPVFKDGRAYSHARLLRERFGFKGEIRAVGHVLKDQYLFMRRCGFDAFEVAQGEDPADWRKQAAAFSAFYQRAADARPSVLDLRHAKPAE
jgi:uncharacterized protein (DUF934 family)